MTQEIAYGGYTANPSDHECSDGDLALAVGLVPEDGAVKPVLPAKEMYELSEGQKVVALHETSSFLHYIVVNEASSAQALEYFTDDDQTCITIYTFDVGEEIRSVETIGNTLIALTTAHMHYFLWNADEQEYLYLGTHLPELPISFGLQGEMKRSDLFTLTVGYAPNDWIDQELEDVDDANEGNDSIEAQLTESVLAQVNKFIADEATNAGKFIFPFFVRYAYRLYDGSLTMHSAPILMVCCTDIMPGVGGTYHKTDTYQTTLNLRVVAMVHQLDYSVISESALEELRNWEDIVKSVDIFISQPIYTYDQSGKVEKFSTPGVKSDSYSICSIAGEAASSAYAGYRLFTFEDLYYIAFSSEINSGGWGNFSSWSKFTLPKKTDETIIEDIQICSTFYLLKSYDLDELATSRTIIEIADDYLGSLVNREAMTDDYDSHDELVPNYSFAYNSRLNLANISKRLFEGFNADALFCHTTWSGRVVGDYDSSYYNTDVKVFIYIKDDGKTRIVEGEEGSCYDTKLLYIYYPNANAYKAVVQYGDTYYEVKLTAHDLLNGAYYFSGWDGITSEGTEVSAPTASSDEDRLVEIKNAIYTSEISNPFYFPVTGINTVGVGTIIGISSAAKALSQGQFGEFPLYAFCSDGVWALSVSSDGGYSAIQPITRDVCINTDSITQIDSAVLFATNRGIMLISGSNVICISDPLKSEDIFSLTDLPRYDKLLQVYNNKADESEQLTVADIDMLQFPEFVSGCQIVYDYTNQHIIIYNPSVKYAYVYSLKSQKWGMIHSTITSSFNSYPRALAMQGTTLVNFSESDATTVTTFAITRPFKMGDGNQFKTIDTIIQWGYFKSDHVCQVLYGSNDLFHWFPIWSSVDKYLRGFRGSPYKAFRLALVGKLDRAESIYGFTVQFNPRLGNQPR